MEDNTNKKEEMEMKYLKCKIHVVNFGEAEVNGIEEEEENPKMPLIYNDRWYITIDLDLGKILNWTQGTTARTWYRVFEEGNSYQYLDENLEQISIHTRCFLHRLAIWDGESGYVKRITLDIEADGTIKDFIKC